MKPLFDFLHARFPALARHRGRSAAARNARANMIAALGVVGLVVGAIVYAVAISGNPAPSADAPQNIPRWWTQAQAENGAQIYQEHCAECHGKNADANNINWREKAADGNYPPPPLNGTAHTWHHDLGALRRTIRFGGAPLGGVMPEFQSALSPEEIDAVIAHFQSLWPEDIYRRWEAREKRRRQ